MALPENLASLYVRIDEFINSFINLIIYQFNNERFFEINFIPFHQFCLFYFQGAPGAEGNAGPRGSPGEKVKSL